MGGAGAKVAIVGGRAWVSSAVERRWVNLKLSFPLKDQTAGR